MRASRMIGLCAFLAMIAAWPCRAEETPFAVPPPAGPGQAAPAVSPLGDIMSKAQMRHIKLWYAIKARNWDLAIYEAEHLQDTFVTAVVLYRNIPIEYIVAADKALGGLTESIKAKDATASVQRFERLTDECNTCHRAAGIGFVAIQVPTSSPFSNQRIAPPAR